MTAITGDAILYGGFSDMEDLSTSVPNLYCGMILPARRFFPEADHRAVWFG
ncbi:MAG: hypothetical protein PVF50_09415 [Gammaproteobacteria bacterium]